jgi:predicted nuclease of predicted toxin-antitoxin system
MTKILIDMNLSPKWINLFDAEGWEAVHWSKIGDFGATDKVIMKWAKDNI